MRALKERGFSPRVVFVDADDEVLIRRFESVRRSHPLQGDGRLADGIAAERKLLEEARELADVIIDTSHLNVNQLRRRVEELLPRPEVEVRALIPYSRGDLINKIHLNGEFLTSEHTADGTLVLVTALGCLPRPPTPCRAPHRPRYERR